MTRTKLTGAQEAELSEYRNSVAHLPAPKRANMVAAKRRELEGAVRDAPGAPEKPPEAPKQPATTTDTPQRPRIIRHGPLTWVECDLEGYEGVRVGYDLDARYSAISGPVKNDDGLGEIRRLMTLCPEWEELPLDPMTEEPPRPVYGDVMSYAPLFMRCLPLTIWAIKDGLNKALGVIEKN